ncbi:DNA mismatch repair endonuclease MutL [Paenibacillus sp. PAMC21692]|uniref:DNA mismatch repair endonuclease MutL n=1 Tax=Paenibacillus sp. PAMC21692 TaxID=2762320 RepID=UPI00164D29B7|nr:DNA mismatch repair endonuclease MutL [Paenibacillus sp. PAMC21692]QNK55247.1 DNA mismatch repair endonuclease MutL [Paenibacillus sp. PAMC21692]
MARIKVLDEQLANQIAAGEVVERPSSVVKELVENAVDAGATVIDVTIEEGGLSLVRVSDNGSGIEGDDLPAAFQRHATSKIYTGSDLFRIASLGFRGEALPSIAAVSRMTCISATDGSGLARRLVIEGGTTTAFEAANAPQGTDMSVRDLFYNTPARLKYMKSIQTELGHISDYVNRIALGHPGIAITLKHNGSVLLRTLGTGDRLQVIAAVYGTSTAKAMLPVAASDADYELNGYISKPELTRANRGSITVIVNGRYIRSHAVNQSLIQAYHTLLPINRFPLVVVELGMHPGLLDVNVHPSKMEVRFSKEAELRSLIERSVKSVLDGLRHIPGPASVGKRDRTGPLYVQDTISFHIGDRLEEGDPAKAPLPEPPAEGPARNSGSLSAEDVRELSGSAEVLSSTESQDRQQSPSSLTGIESPSNGSQEDRPSTSSSSTGYESPSIGRSEEKPGSSKGRSEWSPEQRTWGGSGRSAYSQAGSDGRGQKERSWNDRESAYVPRDAAERLYARPESAMETFAVREGRLGSAPAQESDDVTDRNDAEATVSNEMHGSTAMASALPQASQDSLAETSALREAAAAVESPSERESGLTVASNDDNRRSQGALNFPELHWIGQHHGTYIVAQADDGLYLIDQHAAHERINYEYYLHKFGNPVAASQGLIVPLTLEFTAGEAAQLRECIGLFADAGVEIEPFGSQTFLVRAYPEWFPAGEEQSLLEEMADLLIEERKSINITKLREKAAIMCSCKASIKANDRLSREEGDALLARLSRCEQPYTCPHGRPIIVHLSTYQLEKMFKRVMS